MGWDKWAGALYYRFIAPLGKLGKWRMVQDGLNQKLAKNDDLIHVVVRTQETKQHGTLFSVHTYAFLNKSKAEAVRDEAIAKGTKSGIVSLYIGDNEGGGWGSWSRPDDEIT